MFEIPGRLILSAEVQKLPLELRVSQKDKQNTEAITKSAPTFAEDVDRQNWTRYLQWRNGLIDCTMGLIIRMHMHMQQQLVVNRRAPITVVKWT